MKHTQKTLMMTLFVFVGVAILIILLFEGGLLPCGIMLDRDKSAEFVLATVMEFCTICVIPVALKLFQIKNIKKRISTSQSLVRWGLLRLFMLGIPMIINVLLYYLFMNAAFGYLAIIIFLCLFFIVPTKERCMAEMNSTTKSSQP